VSSVKNQEETPYTSNLTPSSNDLSSTLKNSEIVVIVTGGFHTDGLKKILKERGINYVSITPNVTKDNKFSSEIYDKLAVEQAKNCSSELRVQNPSTIQVSQLITQNSKLALALSSQMSSQKLFELAINAANKQLRETGITDKANWSKK